MAVNSWTISRPVWTVVLVRELKPWLNLRLSRLHTSGRLGRRETHLVRHWSEVYGHYHFYPFQCGRTVHGLPEAGPRLEVYGGWRSRVWPLRQCACRGLSTLPPRIDVEWRRRLAAGPTGRTSRRWSWNCLFCAAR